MTNLPDLYSEPNYLIDPTTLIRYRKCDQCRRRIAYLSRTLLPSYSMRYYCDKCYKRVSPLWPPGDSFVVQDIYHVIEPPQSLTPKKLSRRIPL